MSFRAQCEAKPLLVRGFAECSPEDSIVHGQVWQLVTDIALLKGPNLRHDGNVAIWEALDKHSEFNVVAFACDPPRFNHEKIDLPVRKLPWPDGKYDLLGYDHFFFRAIRKVRFPPGYLRGVKSVCEEFDIVHTSENFNLFSIQAALATKNTDTKFAFHASKNIPYPRSQHNPLLWQLKKFTNRRADAITATTILDKRALIHEGVTHDKIAVLPNSVDLSLFEPLDAPEYQAVGLDSLYAETTNILFVHKLCEQKGTPYLIEAFESLQSKHDDLRLILVGESRLETSLERRIETNDAIQWLEFVPFEEMVHLYNCADLTVLPSVTMVNNEEQFGMSVLEAMACGVPSVVTDVGGIPSVVDEDATALVVDERDAAQLEAGIEKLILSPGRRSQMGANARERAVSVFGSEIISESLADLYRHI